MILQDVLKEFLFDCRLRKLSDRTLKGYRNNNLALFRYLKSEYQVTMLEDVLYQMIQSYIELLMNKGLKETYINGLIKCFRAFFSYCVDETYIPKNPMYKVKFQKQPITLIHTFSDREVGDMVTYYSGSRYLDVRNKLIMILLFDTGIRNSELCGLKMSDIQGTHINIIGKGNKQRFVPITPMINKYLIKYLRVREQYIKDKFRYETEYLLLSQKGRKLTIETIERLVLDAGTGVGVHNGVRISPHTCRHFYAQAQLRNGCDLYTLSKLLGHSNINITKIYLQSMDDENFLNMAIRTSPLENL